MRPLSRGPLKHVQYITLTHYAFSGAVFYLYAARVIFEAYKQESNVDMPLLPWVYYICTGGNNSPTSRTKLDSESANLVTFSFGCLR